jgi:hypothetical protein
MELKKRLLRQILGLSDIPDHAEAERVNASFVERIELRKCVMITGLRTSQNFRFRRSRLRGPTGFMGNILKLANFLFPGGFRYRSFSCLLRKPGTWHALPLGGGIGSTE